MKRFLIALSLSSMLAAPAFAQSKAELAAQDARLAQRLTVLEQRFLTGDPAAAQLMQRTDQLETTVRNLTGEIETLKYERNALRSEVEALAGDVRAIQELKSRMEIHLQAVDMVAEERARGMQPGMMVQPGMVQPSAPVRQGQSGQTMVAPSNGQPPAGMPPFGTVAAPGAAVPSVDMASLPNAGRTKLAEGDFLGAQSSFKQYLDANPTADDAGEVNFWLGESYFVRGQYADSAAAYIEAMRKDSRGPKAPEAMVKLAASLRELGNMAEACQTLSSFPKQYPGADASVQEKARVERSRTGC
jgi:tol-pal system protein YbgF